VPAPKQAQTYAVGVTVLDVVRKAKADANLSMAAPLAGVTIRATDEARAALEPMLDDIARMLKIESIDWSEAAPAEGAIEVDVRV
jgi:valyl-tRNA synthetase